MENKPINPKKRFSWVVKVLLGVGIMGVILLLSAIAGAWYLRGKLPNELKQLVYKKSKGVYTLDFDQMRVNLIGGNVRLIGLSLKADTNQYFKQGDSSKVLVNISAETFSLKGIQVWSYLRSKELHVEGIQLDNPSIFLLHMPLKVKPDSIEDKSSLFDKIPEPLKGLQLAFIEVNQLSFSQNKLGYQHQKPNVLKGISFKIEDIKLDEEALADTNRLWFSKQIELDSRDVAYNLSDSLYLLKLGRIAISSAKKQIQVEQFQLIPRLNELEFYRKLGTEGDRYDLTISNIILKNLDFKGLETSGQIFADSLILSGGDIKIFNNKTLPETGKNKIRNAPHLALQRLKIPINIQTLALQHFTVSYREKTPVSNAIGNVLFTHLNGAFDHVTNDSAAIKANPWATSHFEMDFLDKAKVKVDLNLDLSSPVGAFTYTGSMAPARVSDFNVLLQPMAMMKATKGYISRLTFDIKANMKGASGYIDFHYKDLAADMLIRENNGAIGRRGLLSFLANELVIIPSNPISGEAVRRPQIHYTHPATRSFFNLMWKGVFEGIKQTVNAYGQDARQRKEIQRQLRKESRKERREQRRQKRAAKKAG